MHEKSIIELGKKLFSKILLNLLDSEKIYSWLTLKNFSEHLKLEKVRVEYFVYLLD